VAPTPMSWATKPAHVARAHAIVTFTAPASRTCLRRANRRVYLRSPIGFPDEAITSSLGLNVITAKDSRSPRRARVS